MDIFFAMVGGLIIIAVSLKGAVIIEAWWHRRAKVRAEEEVRDAEFDRAAQEVHKASPIIKDIEGD